MSSVHKKVFLSVVTNEFASGRALLAANLKLPNLDVAVQKDFIVSGGKTLAKLDDYIQQCDAVIHVIGLATGSIPGEPAVATWLGLHRDATDRLPFLADALRNPQPGFSYTQWEAYFALYHGRPLLIYVPDDFESDTLKVPRDPSFVFNAAEAKLQRAHFQRLCSIDHDRGRFVSNEGLSIAALRSVNKILWPKPAIRPMVIWCLSIILAATLAAGIGISIHLASKQVRKSGDIENEMQANQGKITAMLVLISQKQLVNGQETPQPLPVTLTATAESLAQQNVPLGQAAAMIVNRKYSEADQILQTQLARTDLSPDERFKLYTLSGDSWFRAGDPDKAVAPYNAALEIKRHDITALRNAIAANSQAINGDAPSLGIKRKRAIELSNELLGRTPKGTLAWAMTSYQIGIMLYAISVADDAGAVGHKKNLYAAIDAIEAALAVPAFKTENLSEWGNAQDYLGACWYDLASLDLGGDPSILQHELTEALKAFRQAANTFPKESFPDRWVAEQIHIGSVLHDLPENHSENIVEAIEVLKEALKLKHTPDEMWATGYKILGKCQGDMADLPGQDKRACLYDAIASKKATLKFYFPTTNPPEYELSIKRLAEYRAAYDATGAATTRPYDSIPPAD